MKRSRANRLTTTFESFATVLLVAMTVSPSLVPAAYGQQEVDPTWYSPWVEAHQADAHASQAQLGDRLNQNTSGTHRAKSKKQANVRALGEPLYRRKLSTNKQSLSHQSSQILKLD